MPTPDVISEDEADRISALPIAERTNDEIDALALYESYAAWEGCHDRLED